MRFTLVDFLKGVAITAVVALHVSSFTQTNLPHWLSWLLELCVPLFVVLMAFNFALSWQRNSNLKEYFKRRAKRYLPIFAVAWVASLLIGLAFSLPLQFGERQLVGFFPLSGAGNYFIPIVFQFVLLFPLLYFIFRKLGRLAFTFSLVATVAFEGIVFYRVFNLAYITYQYNLLRFFFLIWLGFALSKRNWLKKQFVFQPFNWLGRKSYHLFISQIVFFSEFGRLFF